MKNVHVKPALLLLLTVFCFQLFAQKDIDKLKSEIESINAKLIKANIARDLETIASFYTDDIIHMPNYAPMVKGKEIVIEKEKETWEAGFKMLSMNLTIVDVMTCENLVIEIGEYAISLTIPEMDFPEARAIWKARGYHGGQIDPKASSDGSITTGQKSPSFNNIKNEDLKKTPSPQKHHRKSNRSVYSSQRFSTGRESERAPNGNTRYAST